MTMEKGTISEINEGIQRHVGSKFRRSLKEIQVSADKEKCFESNMVHPDKTSLKVKQPRAMEKVVVAEKENVPSLRRSKRKTATEKSNYVESPVECPKTSKSKNAQTKKTVTKPKKTRSVAAKKTEQKPALNQTKLDFSATTTTTVKEKPVTPQLDLEKISNPVQNNEDSGFDPSCGAGDQSPMNSTAISKSEDTNDSSSVIPYNISAITADSPPLHYWRDLAEQRRMALEKALHENELLHDQLTVLEAENCQLKQLLREAENLAEVVRAIID